MATHRILSSSSMGGTCPPLMVSLVFPSFDGWPVVLSGDGTECLVTVPEGTPPPADLGPLVKVELVPPQD